MGPWVVPFSFHGQSLRPGPGHSGRRARRAGDQAHLPSRTPGVVPAPCRSHSALSASLRTPTADLVPKHACGWPVGGAGDARSGACGHQTLQNQGEGPHRAEPDSAPVLKSRDPRSHHCRMPAAVMSRAHSAQCKACGKLERASLLQDWIPGFLAPKASFLLSFSKEGAPAGAGLQAGARGGGRQRPARPLPPKSPALCHRVPPLGLLLPSNPPASPQSSARRESSINLAVFPSHFKLHSLVLRRSRGGRGGTGSVGAASFACGTEGLPGGSLEAREEGSFPAQGGRAGPGAACRPSFGDTAWGQLDPEMRCCWWPVSEQGQTESPEELPN